MKHRTNNMQTRLFLSIITMILFCIFVLLVPFWAPYDPYEINYGTALAAPCKEYLLGTDYLGRCVFSRVLYGIRSSVLLGFGVVILRFLIGVTLGTIAGYFGGIIDSILMRITDMLLALPNMVIAIAVVGVLGLGWKNTMLALLVTGWVSFARLSRGLIMPLREKTFIKSAILSGNNRLQIIIHYLLPNMAPQLTVQFFLNIGSAIIGFSGLVFLGLGVQPPTPELGVMVYEGKNYMQTAPWTILAPAVAILFIVLLFNNLGNTLRDYFDLGMH